MGSPSSLGEESTPSWRKRAESPSLQWGRRVHSAKRAYCQSRGSDLEALQWGRRVHSAKSLIQDMCILPVSALQWGRRVHSAKSLEEFAETIRQDGLQWGRRVHSAKSVAGAAAQYTAAQLQWGRRVHSAKSPAELDSIRARLAASMGSPSSLGEEVPRPRPSSPADSSFNGVAEFTRRRGL